MQTFLQQRLAQREQAHLYRRRLVHAGVQSPLLTIEGRTYLAFCSNDYLGLASHPDLIRCLQQAANQYAVGAGASHLINGHTQAHHALEEELAAFTGRERALLFSTGYMANMGTVTALVERQDAIFADKLNHASLVDAAQLSRAHHHRYAHNDMSMLARLLSQTMTRHQLIVTDGVFSMDGDLADLPQIVALAKQHQAWVMVDDAHGFGVLGTTGGGTVAHYQLSATDVPILMGTLGKAFGVTGAFVAGSALLIENLIQYARSYIYTTALPPALAETLRTSLKLVQAGSEQREKLQALIQQFRRGATQLGLPLLPSMTPIQGILLGEAEKALQLSQALYQQGILVTAIRPPTVPPHTARLRITFSALHTPEQVDKLLLALAQHY
ncbi:8-amino-7-oxononanoate synthase [Beggiatoa alba B18LD]|uniref:8-amino-7-oxononanoate synthase n=1 Tax=Beggiatoa alba B18LD TaxID=395493 RepID=I3CBM0_9GAMM|nr:8-amino-7-oxononanoate synthase [Beggiatoa alba]EIJ41013.1 8-amino-7-oxononanoate synthase [Beggiatoa alba B18LD]